MGNGADSLGELFACFVAIMELGGLGGLGRGDRRTMPAHA